MKMGKVIIPMLCGFLGIILAFIQKTLYDRGLLVTALSNMGVTLVELMTVTIILFILVGFIIGMARG